MSEKKTKNCPFNQSECTSSCALFIDTSDLNELLAARLSSLGVLNREEGICSFVKKKSYVCARYEKQGLYGPVISKKPALT